MTRQKNVCRGGSSLFSVIFPLWKVNHPFRAGSNLGLVVRLSVAGLLVCKVIGMIYCLGFGFVVSSPGH